MAKTPTTEAKVDVKIEATGASQFKAATRGLGTGITVGLITAVAEGKKLKAVWEGIKWTAIARVGATNLAMLAGSTTAAVNALHKLIKGTEMYEQGMRRAGSIEFKTTQFETLLRGAGLAKKRIQELVKFGAETPFEIEGIVEASKMLEVLGRGDLSGIKTLTMVGDAASVAGRELNEVAFWVGRFYDGLKSGRPVGEAATRLQEMGLITGTLRAKIEDVSKAGGDMSVVWSDVQRELERTKGGMKKMSQNLTGLQSTLADVKADMAGAIASGFLDQEKEHIIAMIKVTENLTPVMADLSGVTARTTGYWERLTDRIKVAVTGSKAFQDTAAILSRALNVLAPLATIGLILKLAKAIALGTSASKLAAASTTQSTFATNMGAKADAAAIAGKFQLAKAYAMVSAAAERTALATGAAAAKKTAATGPALRVVGAGANLATWGKSLQGTGAIGKAFGKSMVVAGGGIRVVGLAARTTAVGVGLLGKAFKVMLGFLASPLALLALVIGVIWKLVDGSKAAAEGIKEVKTQTSETISELEKLARTVKDLNGLWEYQGKIVNALTQNYASMSEATQTLINTGRSSTGVEWLDNLVNPSEYTEAKGKMEELVRQREQLQARLQASAKMEGLGTSEKGKSLMRDDAKREKGEEFTNIEFRQGQADSLSERLALQKEKVRIAQEREKAGRNMAEGSIETEKETKPLQQQADILEARIKSGIDTLAGANPTRLGKDVPSIKRDQEALAALEKKRTQAIKDNPQNTQKADDDFYREAAKVTGYKKSTEEMISIREKIAEANRNSQSEPIRLTQLKGDAIKNLDIREDGNNTIDKSKLTPDQLKELTGLGAETKGDKVVVTGNVLTKLDEKIVRLSSSMEDLDQDASAARDAEREERKMEKEAERLAERVRIDAAGKAVENRRIDLGAALSEGDTGKASAIQKEVEAMEEILFLERKRIELRDSDIDPADIEPMAKKALADERKARAAIRAETVKGAVDAANADYARLRVQDLILKGRFEEAAAARDAADQRERELKIAARVKELSSGPDGLGAEEARLLAEAEAGNDDRDKQAAKADWRRSSELRIEEMKAEAEGGTEGRKKAQSIRDFGQFENLRKDALASGVGEDEAKKVARREMEQTMLAESRDKMQVTGSFLRSVGGGGRAVGNDPAQAAAERLRSLDKTANQIYTWLSRNQGREWADPDDTFTIR